jgi:hypothetical protein
MTIRNRVGAFLAAVLLSVGLAACQGAGPPSVGPIVAPGPIAAPSPILDVLPEQVASAVLTGCDFAVTSATAINIAKNFGVFGSYGDLATALSQMATSVCSSLKSKSATHSGATHTAVARGIPIKGRFVR